MRALVIGAGVVGVTTAFCLHSEGYDVTVVDSASAPGAGASNVNAGLLVPGDSTIWPNPGAPKQIAHAIAFPRKGPLRIHPAALPRLAGWGARFLSACRPEQWRRHSAASLALSRYSYAELRKTLRDLPIDVHHKQSGMVFLFDNLEALAAGRRAHTVLEDLGETYQQLKPHELVALDAGYSHAAGKIAGAIYSSSCGSADCGSFTRQLAKYIEERGVAFSLDNPVVKLDVRGRTIKGAITQRGRLDADLVVLAAGHASPKLTNRLFHLPIVPARGYSVTVPILASHRVPRIGGVDDRSHVAYSRMGDLLRVTSTAEIGAESRTPTSDDYSAIRTTIERLFPETCDWARARYEIGYRPMMPADVPAIGATPIAGLYLNTGHGHLGWTQASGSARLLLDLIKGRPTEINAEQYRLRQ